MKQIILWIVLVFFNVKKVWLWASGGEENIKTVSQLSQTPFRYSIFRYSDIVRPAPKKWMNVKWLFAIMNTKMNKDGVKISLSKTKPEEKLGGCIAPFLLLERAGLEAPELKLHPETDDRDRVLVEKGASHSKSKTSHFSDSILLFFSSLSDFCLPISLPACQLHNFWKCCLLRFAVDIKAPLWRINRSWVKVSLFCEIVHVSTEHWTVPSLKKRSVTDPPLIDRFSSLTFSHHQ